MRWFLRAICLIVILIAIATVVARKRVADTKAALLGAPPVTEPQPDSIPQQAKENSQPTSPQEDTDVGVPYQTPLGRGLGQMIDSTSQVLNGQEDQLRENLMQADEMLADVREQNRRAMREASRQVRLPGARSPNILLLVFDGLSVEDLSCYGGSRVTTTHMDQLASSGVRFTNFYAGPSTKQAHLALRSGTGESNVKNRIGTTLWQAGYQTVLIGDASRADVAGRTAEAHGYELWFGSRDGPLEPDSYPTQLWSSGSRVKVLTNGDGKQVKTAEQICGSELTAFWQRKRGRHPFAVEFITSVGAASDSSSRHKQLQRLDETVGRLMQTLDRSGYRRNTAVVLLGTGYRDGQTAAAGSLRRGEHGMYEGDLRAPLIIAWAGGGARAGETSALVCSTIDILPTLTHIASAIRKPRMTGKSLIPAIRDPGLVQQRTLIWQSSREPQVHCVRDGEWKLIAGDRVELFSLDEDPAESRNVAAEQPEVVEELRSLLDQAVRNSAAAAKEAELR